jgi:hypothetical protein
MSFADALIEILAQAKAAAQTEAPAARGLSGHSAPGRLAAVLTEISETILPRALTFATGDDVRLVVEARSRRLAKIEDVAGCEAAAGDWAADLADATVDEAREVAAMARILISFAAVNGPLTVTSRPTGLPASFVNKGHTTDAVAAAVTAEGGSVAPDAAPEPTVDDTAADAPAPDATSERNVAASSGAGALDAFYDALAASGSGAARASRSGKISSAEGLLENGGAADLAKALIELEKASAPFAEPLIQGDALVVIATGDRATCLCFGGGAAEIVFGAASEAQLTPVLTGWAAAIPERH